MSKVALSLVILAALVGLNSCLVSYENILQAEWSLYKTEFQKTYANADEEFRRFNNYLESRHIIAKHNELNAKREVSFNMGLNQFSDMTYEEFRKRMSGLKPTARRDNYSINANISLIHKSTGPIPDSIDWREHGYVTPVKDQGACGSCWAFSATGALEGQQYRKTGRLVALSEQNLIDCSYWRYLSFGCSGGDTIPAYNFISKEDGIDTEESYPYEARNGSCRFDKSHVGATVAGFILIDPKNETDLTRAIAHWGPVSVAVDHRHMMHYKSGVYDEPACSSEINNLHHGMLAVGYGTDPDGRDYYIVKNSWSEKWGENGYVRMSRNKNNQCGIATHASIPIV